MGINLGNDTTPASQPLNSQMGAPGLSLNLSKNDVLDLTKRNPALRNVKLGAGWDVNQMGGPSFDLDVAAFMLNANGKITSGADVVFFNNRVVPGVTLSADNRTGAGEGDDETIEVNLSQIPAHVHKVVFAINIFDAQAKGQSFDQINNAYVRLLDMADNDRQICVYKLRESFAGMTAVIVGELVRNGADWDFKALGEGRQGDLNSLAGSYM